MRINNNLMAMNTYRQLGIGNTASAKSMEKLSSGYRINRAGDDAAGLAISEKMRGQIRGLNQASRNAQDGISLIQTAEGALNETHAILQRMRELAVQSANDTNIASDRDEIQKEIDELAKEITRIANNTEFNTQKLLNGGINDTTGLGKLTFQIGANSAQNLSIEILAMDASTLGIARDTVSATVTGDHISNVNISAGAGVAITGGASITATYAAGDAGDPGEYAAVTINGIEFKATAVGDTLNGKTITIEQGSTDDTPSTASKDGSGNYTITIGMTGGSTIVSDNDSLLAEIQSALTNAGYTEIGAAFATGTDGGDTATVPGTDSLAGGENLVPAGSDTVTLSDGINTSIIVVASGSGTITGTGAFAGLSFTSDDFTALDGSSQQIDLTGNTSTGALFTGGTTIEARTAGGINVSTKSAADVAITTIQTAIEKVSAERSKFGAIQNRLEHTIKNLDTSAENLQASESRIRDVDMAKEMMEFTKNNILQQAAQAMLAQANQAPQGVLQLLR